MSPYCNGYRKWNGEVEWLDIVKGKWRVVGTNGRLGAPSKQLLLEEKGKVVLSGVGAPRCCLSWLLVIHLLPLLTLASPLTACLEPLARRPNGPALVFGRYTSELFKWFHFFILGWDLLVILLDCYIFLSPSLDVIWNFVLIECFPLTYDVNSINSRINRHLLSVGSS